MSEILAEPVTRCGQRGDRRLMRRYRIMGQAYVEAHQPDMALPLARSQPINRLSVGEIVSSRRRDDLDQEKRKAFERIQPQRGVMPADNIIQSSMIASRRQRQASS